MNWLAWVGVGLAVWVAIAIPTALGVGRALRRVVARQTTAPSRPNLRVVA